MADDISKDGDTPEETSEKAWMYAVARISDLMVLMSVRFRITEAQAANELLLAVVQYASNNCAGPFEEPLKTEIDALREIERDGRRLT